jgi:hypothetical protein
MVEPQKIDDALRAYFFSGPPVRDLRSIYSAARNMGIPTMLNSRSQYHHKNWVFLGVKQHEPIIHTSL